MAAHHAAQRQHQYSIPPPPPPSNVFNDELRLPSIKDLAFKYERPRQEPSQNSGAAPQPASEFLVSSSQERTRAPSQSWGRPTPAAITTHHPQQQHTPPTPPLSAGHELSSRHDSGGYLTPGMPLSAQTTPLPGSVSTGPAIRNDDVQNKRPRPSSRDSRQNHVVYAPQYQPYQAPMPPPSPYHQMSPVLAAPPPPIPHSPLPPSPHAHIQHQPSTVPTHPSYPYQQQPQQQSYLPRSSPQHVSPHALSSHPSHTYHPAASQHTHVPQQQQAPPTPSQPQHGVPYPSPTPSVSQEHWEHHHQPQPQHSQHAQPVHAVQHHPVQHAPPPPPTTMHHYSHPPPPPPPTMTSISNHPQQPPLQQPPAQQHPTYAQSVPHPSISHHSLARAVQPVITTPIVPTPEADTRNSYTANTAKSSTRESTMTEIVKLCSILYDFASRYSSLSSALPHVQPSQTEVNEMARRANDVARLLEALRRMDEPEIKHSVTDEMSTTPDDNRPPKRPWEDMAQDGQAPSDDRVGMFPEPALASAVSGQTTAEQDMELIRSKRATTTAGATTASGQPKSKYRKRSRATPPGKCHSCNIRETPEWRRGPDGARTLCNACGLHYAKLMRKQAKLNANQNGEPPPKIDLDTLKASTKAAEAEKGIKSDENTVPGPAPQHHQGSFQVMSVMSPIEGSPTTSSDPSRLPAHHQTILPPPTSAGTMHPPPPPWAPNVTRTYTPSDQFQSQSFMRTAR